MEEEGGRQNDATNTRMGMGEEDGEAKGESEGLSQEVEVRG